MRSCGTIVLATPPRPDGTITPEVSAREAGAHMAASGKAPHSRDRGDCTRGGGCARQRCVWHGYGCVSAALGRGQMRWGVQGSGLVGHRRWRAGAASRCGCAERKDLQPRRPRILHLLSLPQLGQVTAPRPAHTRTHTPCCSLHRAAPHCGQVLYCAKKAGVTHILKAGGAQAVAAMAWGTASCPKVGLRGGCLGRGRP